MNLLIILATVAVSGLMIHMLRSFEWLAGGIPKEWLRLYAFVPGSFSAAPLSTGHTLLTSIFIHGGIITLLGNMFFLFTTGDDVEKRMGHFPFLFFYLLAGAGAALISMFTGNQPSIPHAGAGGAIAGVIGAYMALCRHKRFYIWVFRIDIFGKMIAVSAWLYLAFWIGFQFLGVKYGAFGNDYWAQAGAFVFGFILGKAVQLGQSYNGLTRKWEWKHGNRGRQ
jgi:membrane associated rhomboid family serine protease